MRKFLLFVFLICMMGTMCSCSKTDSNEEYYSVSSAEMNQEAARIQEVALDAFKNEDIAKLENEFSEYATENANLNDEIENAFEFIEGNIITVEDSYVGDGGGSKDEKGDARVDYKVNLFNVRTDKYKNYQIRIYGIFFYRNNEHKQGINRISVRDRDTERKCVVGIAESKL